MMKDKKKLSVLLAFVLLFSAAGCDTGGSQWKAGERRPRRHLAEAENEKKSNKEDKKSRRKEEELSLKNTNEHRPDRLYDIESDKKVFNKNFAQDLSYYDADYVKEGCCCDQIDLDFIMKRTSEGSEDWLYIIFTNNSDQALQIRAEMDFISEEGKAFERVFQGKAYALNPGHRGFTAISFNFEKTKEHKFHIVSLKAEEGGYAERMDVIEFDYQQTPEGLELTVANPTDERLELGLLMVFMKKGKPVFVDWVTFFSQGSGADPRSYVQELIKQKKIPEHDYVDVIYEAYAKTD